MTIWYVQTINVLNECEVLIPDITAEKIKVVFPHLSLPAWFFFFPSVKVIKLSSKGNKMIQVMVSRGLCRTQEKSQICIRQLLILQKLSIRIVFL